MPDITAPNKEGLLLSIRVLISSVIENTQLPKEFLLGLVDSDDWSLIIKLHSMVELALNQLITYGIGDGRVLEIVMRLDTSDKQRGKMAFVKALDLLPTEARAFVANLSKLRNDLVHDVSNFNFSLAKWIKEMEAPELTNFTKSLNFDCDGSREYWYCKHKNDFRNLPASDLKAILMFSCFSILFAAIDKEFEKFKEPLEREEKRLQGLIDSFEAGLKIQSKRIVT
jgi:hypothetical protein